MSGGSLAPDTRPTQHPNPPAPVSRAPNRGPPLRAQNALAVSSDPGRALPRPPLPPLGPHSSGSTAPTVLDDPPRLPTPTPPRIPIQAQVQPRPLPPPRHAQPTRPRLVQPAPRASANTAATPRAPTTVVPRVPTVAAPRAPISTTCAPAQTAPRESTPAPGTSGGTSHWLTFDDDDLEPLPEPITQPQPRLSTRASAPSSSRMVNRLSHDLGGPAPGIPPCVRPYIPYTDLVSDRAEEFAAAEARVNGRRVTSGRKPKPHARNYHGDERMMIPFTAKYHFGLMLVDNPYGNRMYSRQTAMEAFEDRWAKLLPRKELRMPDDEYFNWLVNRSATSRGDARNRIRPVAHSSGGFIHPARTREDIQFNMAQVAALLPNRFHYASLDPPANPYGNIDISRALGAALFHSTTAVGAVHCELFGPLMPLQPIAFILTNFQVCIGEFSTGRYEPVDLNAAAQYQMYISYARGLETFEQRAPGRMRRMQQAWYQYALAFAGIDEDKEQADALYQDAVPLEDIRPDTPEPGVEDAPDLPELPSPEDDAEQQIGCDEDGWQQYSHEELYGNEPEPTDYEHEPEEEDEREPEPEYNDTGRFTARAKGKGPAAPGPPRRTR